MRITALQRNTIILHLHLLIRVPRVRTLSNLSPCLSWCFCNLLIRLGGSREKWPGHFIASLISIKFCFLVPSLRIFSLSFRDVKCGKIHCSRGQHSFLPGKEKINHLKKISKQNVTTECKTFILYHNSKDLGLVAPGTKCGDGMVRWKSFVLLKLLGSATFKTLFSIIGSWGPIYGKAETNGQLLFSFDWAK